MEKIKQTEWEILRFLGGKGLEREWAGTSSLRASQGVWVFFYGQWASSRRFLNGKNYIIRFLSLKDHMVSMSRID